MGATKKYSIVLFKKDGLVSKHPKSTFASGVVDKMVELFQDDVSKVAVVDGRGNIICTWSGARTGVL